MKFDDVAYAVNKEFQDHASQLADTLDLDEIEAARLLIEAEEDLELFDRPIVVVAIVGFHQRQQFRLESLRLLFSLAIDVDAGDEIRGSAREITGLVLGIRRDGPGTASDYIKKCLQAMFDIETTLHSLTQRHQGSVALGQVDASDPGELTVLQQSSLTHQHQSLSGILTLLVKASYSTPHDFQDLLAHLAHLDRWNRFTAHYMPVVLSMTFQHGSPEGTSSLQEARSLHTIIFNSKEASSWAQRQLQAAIQIWWLSEYSGWYQEPPGGSPLQGIDLEAEAHTRSETFLQALADGALECVLSLCSQVSTFELLNPARHSLVRFLLRDAPFFQQDTFHTSEWFGLNLMEQLEIFSDALITNMPDTLRHFKQEEDDQRKRSHSHLQQTIRGGSSGQEFHLERFLVIIAFSFDQRPDAAQAFWGDVDSNLYGFLQWAARRQSTPCASSFCEMLQSISRGEEYASAAHDFLLGEGNGVSSRARRHGSLGWHQILGELTTYSTRIREPPGAARSSKLHDKRSEPDDIDEPESALMLESYLRLTSHLCCESERVRAWILSYPNPGIVDIMLTLCNASIPSQLQGCAFSTIRSLLNEHSTEMTANIWTALDVWASGSYAPSNIVRSKNINPASWLKDTTPNAITRSFEQANEFTRLLHALVIPVGTIGGLNDQLPFPETLGSSYRMPGIDPYVDIIIKDIFLRSSNITEDSLKTCALNASVLEFMVTCLTTFNEDLLLLANKSTLVVDEMMSTSSLVDYIKLHPFRRVMDWLFSNNVLLALFGILHQNLDALLSPQPPTTVLKCVLQCLDVMDQMTNLQSTYVNIVRPLTMQQVHNREGITSNPSLTSFEDAVSSDLQIVLDLGLYAGAGDRNLAISALNLLGKLTSSRRLRGVLAKPSNAVGNRDILLELMQREGELSRISRPLALAMAIDPKELEHGPQSPDWSMKVAVLRFIVQTLSAAPEQLNMAHALLGFSCLENNKGIAAGNLFDQGLSLFHVIVRLVEDYPDGFDDALEVWALSIRQMGMEILMLLWRSPLTSAVSLREIQRCELLNHLLFRQRPLNTNVIFNGRTVRDHEFLFSESAETLCQVLWQRNFLHELAGNLIRFIAIEGNPALKIKTLSALLGSSMSAEETQPSLGIFDLLDISDISPPKLGPLPQLEYHSLKDLRACLEQDGGSGYRYNLKAVGDLLRLSFNDIKRKGLVEDSNQEQRALSEVGLLKAYCQGFNNVRDLRQASENVTASWSFLVSLVIRTYDFDSESQIACVLQAFQVLSPRLETYILEGDPGAGYVAGLLKDLLTYYSVDTENPTANEVGNDRVLQILRTAIRSVGAPHIETGLREVLYTLCHQCLSQWKRSSLGFPSGHSFVQILRGTGQRTIDVLCDDALGAESSVRIAALLLLDSLCTSMAQERSSSSFVECLLRTNFLQVLIESIESIPQDLRQAAAAGKCTGADLGRHITDHLLDIPSLLASYEAKFALLLSLSQTKAGAVHVVNAGIFSAVQQSGLFSVDPDIGVGMYIGR